jgi:hypothetical protein
MKDTRDRADLKDQVKKWMNTSGVHKQRNALDMMIMETFFFVYNRLKEGHDIHEIGNDLGVFPLP